jgi:hypothetical protein
MKPIRKKLLIVITLTFVLLFGLGISTGYEKWQIGATCPKCLQKASIRKIKIHGFAIYSSFQLNPNPSEQPGTTVLYNSETKISPMLYERILGEKCNHVFKEGGFSRKKGKVYSDGISAEILPYRQRIEAIKELYRIFLNCENTSLAKETYILIDNTLPIAQDKKMIKARELLQLKDEIPLEEYEPYFKEEVQIARSMIQLKNMTFRLKEIETEKQWREFLSEFIKAEETD